jgi:integrase
MPTRSPEKPNPTRRNQQSGSKVAQSNPTEPLPETAPEPVAKRTLSRTHADYWKARLFRRAYHQDGEQREINDLYVRIQHGGRREFFALTSTNQDVAARKAVEIFTFLKANGWDATLAKFKPDAQGEVKLDVTIGDFLSAVEATRRLRTRTFVNYRNCLRTIVAETFGIREKKGESKFDYRSPNGTGNSKWTGRIDEIRLERVTPERVNNWKRERIAVAGQSPASIAAAKRTVNSYIRCARSLFSPALVRELKKVKLPATLPFQGVELEEAGSTKYVSRINAHAIIAAARSQLKKKDPEAYKAFLLALFAGMRKGEIDLAEWGMVDFDANVIRLQETDWLHLKTHDSAAAITADEEMFDELQRFKRNATGPFILESTRPPRNDSVRTYYRCEETFDRLNTWLRSKGITSNKPLHELRKEVGAIVATTHGIYAASCYLRHSDITTTARHYADQKERINVGLGKLLDTSIKPVRESKRAAA